MQALRQRRPRIKIFDMIVDNFAADCWKVKPNRCNQLRRVFRWSLCNKSSTFAHNVTTTTKQFFHVVLVGSVALFCASFKRFISERPWYFKNWKCLSWFSCFYFFYYCFEGISSHNCRPCLVVVSWVFVLNCNAGFYNNSYIFCFTALCYEHITFESGIPHTYCGWVRYKVLNWCYGIIQRRWRNQQPLPYI